MKLRWFLGDRNITLHAPSCFSYRSCKNLKATVFDHVATPTMPKNVVRRIVQRVAISVMTIYSRSLVTTLTNTKRKTSPRSISTLISFCGCKLPPCWIETALTCANATSDGRCRAPRFSSAVDANTDFRRQGVSEQEYPL